MCIFCISVDFIGDIILISVNVIYNWHRWKIKHCVITSLEIAMNYIFELNLKNFVGSNKKKITGSFQKFISKQICKLS